jgi:hypothetical protein
MYSRRQSTKIVLACARFRDGVDSGSYPIILSLRDNKSPYQPCSTRNPKRKTQNAKP